MTIEFLNRGRDLKPCLRLTGNHCYEVFSTKKWHDQSCTSERSLGFNVENGLKGIKHETAYRNLRKKKKKCWSQLKSDPVGNTKVYIPFYDFWKKSITVIQNLQMLQILRESSKRILKNYNLSSKMKGWQGRSKITY